MKFKLIVLFSILCLLIVIPTSFAMDNDTVSVGVNSTSHDYYFDSNVENDSGDGSIDNPYKTLTSDRIPKDSTIHLANGRYILDRECYVNNVSIVGADPEKTIVSYHNGFGFILKGSFSLNNVTLIYTAIKNNGYTLNAENTVFKSFSSTVNSVITQNSNPESIVNLNNCTFMYNSGKYGGAIQMDGGCLNINNSLFINNNALNYGGALYLMDCSCNAINVTILNSSAKFGGAITSIESDLYLTNFISENNKAQYYGGSVYSMYYTLELVNSTLINNTASMGGAVFADSVESFIIHDNKFINNTATSGSAVYSILSDCYYDSIYDSALNNSFVNNDVYESDSLNLTFENNQYILIKSNFSSIENIPSKYDLRELGQVSPVKNQGDGGNCWAFSTLAALESSILKATNVTYDLSEDNMKNLMSFYSSYGWAMETNDGGYDRMGIGYLTGWLGPVNESDDPYDGKSILSPLLTSFIHVQNIVFLTRDNYTDNNAIKKAVMEYGAVSTSLYWSGSYLKGKNYYYKSTEGANHAVVIVGWDDDYDKSNFKNTPKGNGAWIIKNSHGLSSGDDGYVYVSYYDTVFAQPGRYVSYAFVLNDSIKYDKIYQYDVQGRTDFFLNATSTVWYKTKFNSTSDEYLAGVSTYFQKETSWDLLIYVNDVLKLTKSGKSSPSYSTIDLGEFISLKKGDTFEIVFKITVDGDAGVPISEPISLNQETFTEDISFISYDGKNWVDFYDLEGTYPDHIYYSQVACIKAFTVFDEVNTTVSLELSDSVNPTEITATVKNCYGYPVDVGTVTFNVEGKNFKVNVNNGVAKLNYFFKNLSNNQIKATFNANGYASSSALAMFNVTEVSLIGEDLVSYYGNIINYNVTLIDSALNPVSGKEIKFNINNKSYVVKTNSKGIAGVNLKLGIGVYDIVIGFKDDSSGNFVNLVKKITVKSTIDLPAATKYTFNSNYQGTLCDGQGNPLNNEEVDVVVNSVKYNLTTDSDGKFVYTIDLDPGSYVLSIVNKATGEVKDQSINVAARLNSNKDITMYYGAGTKYKVRAYDDNGAIAKNVSVVIRINNKNYNVYTDSKGYAYLKIDLAPKTYTITTTYKGFKVSNKVVVKPTLVMSDKTVKKSKTFSYTVKLLNSKGSILKSKYVKVKYRGKTYSAKTNSKGIATFKLKSYSNVGTFTLTATYGSAKITKKITVKK